MTDKLQVLDFIKAVLRDSLPEDGKAWLYGSRARGDARSDSDWDILLVVDKNSLSLSDFERFTYPLTSMGWEIGEEINPILYTLKEWNESKNTPFRDNVERDGLLLTA